MPMFGQRSSITSKFSYRKLIKQQGTKQTSPSLRMKIDGFIDLTSASSSSGRGSSPAGGGRKQLLDLKSNLLSRIALFTDLDTRFALLKTCSKFYNMRRDFFRDLLHVKIHFTDKTSLQLILVSERDHKKIAILFDDIENLLTLLGYFPLGSIGLELFATNLVLNQIALPLTPIVNYINSSNNINRLHLSYNLNLPLFSTISCLQELVVIGNWADNELIGIIDCETVVSNFLHERNQIRTLRLEAKYLKNVHLLFQTICFESLEIVTNPETFLYFKAKKSILSSNTTPTQTKIASTTNGPTHTPTSSRSLSSLSKFEQLCRLELPSLQAFTQVNLPNLKILVLSHVVNTEFVIEDPRNPPEQFRFLDTFSAPQLQSFSVGVVYDPNKEHIPWIQREDYLLCLNDAFPDLTTLTVTANTNELAIWVRGCHHFRYVKNLKIIKLDFQDETKLIKQLNTFQSRSIESLEIVDFYEYPDFEQRLRSDFDRYVKAHTCWPQRLQLHLMIANANILKRVTLYPNRMAVSNDELLDAYFSHEIVTSLDETRKKAFIFKFKIGHRELQLYSEQIAASEYANTAQRIEEEWEVTARIASSHIFQVCPYGAYYGRKSESKAHFMVTWRRMDQAELDRIRAAEVEAASEPTKSSRWKRIPLSSLLRSMSSNTSNV